MKYLFPFFLIFVSFLSCKMDKNETHILSKENWIVEQQPDGVVHFNNSTIEINDAKGCTVWYRHKLKSPIKIDYEVIVIDSGGVYDRVSDLNCFWMANDPKQPNNFFENSKNRAGIFNNYHSLTQYYVGLGGHNNSKTRFRRYNGNQNRPLLPEHDLSGSEFMIQPNKSNFITIEVTQNGTRYLRNQKVVFTLKDTMAYKQGYFGFRTVNNHMLIKSFKISER